MKILQWTMIIPEEKQKDFVKWFDKTAGPELGKFGAIKHELCRVADREIVGRQTVEKNQYVERVYFNDDFNIPNYFSSVKNDPDAWRISRMYELKFGAKEIELKVLYSASW